VLFAYRKNNAIGFLPLFINPPVATVDNLDYIRHMTGRTDKAEFFTGADLLKTQTYVMVSFSAIAAKVAQHRCLKFVIFQCHYFIVAVAHKITRCYSNQEF